MFPDLLAQQRGEAGVGFESLSAKMIYASSIYMGQGVLHFPELVYQLCIETHIARLSDEDRDAILEGRSLEEHCKMCNFEGWVALWKMPILFDNLARRSYQDFPPITHELLAPGCPIEQCPNAPGTVKTIITRMMPHTNRFGFVNANDPPDSIR